MTDLATLVQHGTSAWMLILSALVLGALHGLEPGHSKTMMAAFIVAVRGTVGQAILLAAAATVSHTAIVWAVALIGMYFSVEINTESSEPYLQTASGILILSIAVWMLFRVWKDQRRVQEEARHSHHHDHEERRRVNTGHGHVTLEVFEKGVPPRWRLTAERGHKWHADEITVDTTRRDGKRQVFTFVDKGDYAESIDAIPEPHEFAVCLQLGHGGHTHTYDLEFREHDHDHSHNHDNVEGLTLGTPEFEDAHQRAHANDIRRRFTNRRVTTGQLVMFGLTGGLIPCGAAITVLLLCLQLMKFVLGVLLVLCFSIGLAFTLMAAGAVAAWGAGRVGKHLTNLPFREFVRAAPYLSSAVVIALGLYVTLSGLHHLP
jgi:nickel/cobalt transporter (NicO) family protein